MQEATISITDAGRGEFTDPDFIARIDALEKQADRDVEAMNVNFRWGREQVTLVKKAAALVGVPYQTYLKQTAWKQAVADIRDAEAVGGKPKG